MMGADHRLHLTNREHGDPRNSLIIREQELFPWVALSARPPCLPYIKIAATVAAKRFLLPSYACER
jgi:hypothetical protein